MSLTTEPAVSASVEGPGAPEAPPAPKPVQTLPSVTIRFAGDSGDGMQLAGTQFTDTSALVGNDISTLPDFPAEIRAPPARWPASAGSRFTSPAPTSSRPATMSTRWWR